MQENDSDTTIEMVKFITKKTYPQFDSHNFKENDFTESSCLKLVRTQLCLNILWTFKEEINKLNYNDKLPVNILSKIPSEYHSEFTQYKNNGDWNWYIWYHLVMSKII